MAPASPPPSTPPGRAPQALPRREHGRHHQVRPQPWLLTYIGAWFNALPSSSFAGSDFHPAPSLRQQPGPGGRGRGQGDGPGGGQVKAKVVALIPMKMGGAKEE